MRIQSGFSIHMNPNWNLMRIECALCSLHLWRWFGSGLKLDYIIIHDLHEITPTMKSLACSLAWLFVVCGACYLGKKECCFLKAEKSGAAR